MSDQKTAVVVFESNKDKRKNLEANYPRLDDVDLYLVSSVQELSTWVTHRSRQYKKIIMCCSYVWHLPQSQQPFAAPDQLVDNISHHAPHVNFFWLTLEQVPNLTFVKGLIPNDHVDVDSAPNDLQFDILTLSHWRMFKVIKIYVNNKEPLGLIKKFLKQYT